MINQTLRFVSYNVRGLSEYKKRRDLVSHVMYPVVGPSPDLLFLQETHSTPSKVKRWKMDFGCNIYCSHNTASSGGLLIAARQELGLVVWKQVSNVNFMVLDCTIHGEDYTLINVYLKPGMTKLLFHQHLTDIASSITRFSNAKF